MSLTVATVSRHVFVKPSVRKIKYLENSDKTCRLIVSDIREMMGRKTESYERL